MLEYEYHMKSLRELKSAGHVSTPPQTNQFHTVSSSATERPTIIEEESREICRRIGDNKAPLFNGIPNKA